MKSVAVIGGGISGLSAAYYLHRSYSDLDIKVYEPADRPGGVIQTTVNDGFLVEDAADNFITTTPDAVELAEELGLADDLIKPSDSGRQACVLSRGRLRPIPPGFIIMAPSRIWPFLTSRILSGWGKLRAAGEVFVPKRRVASDESMESFVCRRFGREMFERLVQPLIGGIYTADPKLLSLAATMPRFSQMEQEHGSLIRAMLKQKKTGTRESSGGARYSQFMTLRGGMSKLVDSIIEKLPANTLQLQTPARAMIPLDNGRWALRVGRASNEWTHVDGVVVATPAHVSSDLVNSFDRRLADELGSVNYASCAVVSLGYRRKQIGVPLNSFGFVVPLIERRLILSCSYSSVKYEGRASKDHVLVRVFIGGACQANLLQLPEDQLMELAEWELSDLMKIQGAPVMRIIKRHMRTMPQYHVGHLNRIRDIDRRTQNWRCLQIAGSALRGVGVPSCIKSGREAALKIVQELSSRQPALSYASESLA
ncbi:MAG: protoporphyrinogen oxidase [Planctomycetales bacterium]|nr:protoporphyrinogen oxidase [Planctomycetales bacterium]